jgi:hypothetical protein
MTLFLTSKQIAVPVPLPAPLAVPIVPEPGAPPEASLNFANLVNGLGKHERYDLLRPILMDAASNGDVSTVESFSPLLDHRDGILLYSVLKTAAAKGHAEIVSIILKQHSSMLLPANLKALMERILDKHDESNPGCRRCFQELFVHWLNWLPAKAMRKDDCTKEIGDLLRRVSRVDSNLNQWCIQQIAYWKMM